MEQLLLPALITIFVFTGILFVLSRSNNEENTRKRLERMAAESGTYDTETGYAAVDNPETNFLDQDDQKSPLAVMGENLLVLLGKSPRDVEKRMQLQFIQAGLYSPNAVGYYYLFKAVALPVSLVVAFILFNGHATGMMRMLQMMSAVGVVFFAWFGPSIYITNTKQKRQKLLQRSFPDTLDLILVCVESGLALDAALARVCRELGRAHPEITKELNRTRMELTLLSDRSVALQNLAERTDMIAFRSLVAALLQTERFGTSLTETLRVLSDDYRHTRLMIAENKAGKLPAMMTVPMILLMMPAFMLIILGPAVIEFTRTWSESSNLN
jgi:pilus assembly protein TadC